MYYIFTLGTWIHVPVTSLSDNLSILLKGLGIVNIGLVLQVSVSFSPSIYISY
jgi:hypothetical protein